MCYVRCQHARVNVVDKLVSYWRNFPSSNLSSLQCVSFFIHDNTKRKPPQTACWLLNTYGEMNRLWRFDLLIMAQTQKLLNLVNSRQKRSPNYYYYYHVLLKKTLLIAAYRLNYKPVYMCIKILSYTSGYKLTINKQ